MIDGAGLSPRQASHFGVRITSLREVSEPPLRDHLSRQMKVTKAKALSILLYRFGYKSSADQRHATAAGRTSAATGNRAPMRSEVLLVFVSPFGRAEQRRALRGARSALQHLTSRRVSERSERSSRSELGATRKDRAAQGSPCAARAESAGVASLPPFLSIQERRSAAGPKPRRGLTQFNNTETRRCSGSRRPPG
jgi:hypothetical protein